MERRHLVQAVERAAAEPRDQRLPGNTAMFLWDPYAAFFPGGGDDVDHVRSAGSASGPARTVAFVIFLSF